MKISRSVSSRHAFSLIEILTVISLIALLAGLSIPAFTQIQSASALAASSGKLVDLLHLARQQATTLGRPVEVRFYELPDPMDASKRVWRGVQLFLIDEGELAPLDRPVSLAPQVKIAESPNHSSLFDGARSDLSEASGTDAGVSLPGAGLNYRYRAFRFRPDGSTTLAEPVCATLQPVNGSAVGGAPSANWFAVQVDSLNGSVQTFRP